MSPYKRHWGARIQGYPEEVIPIFPTNLCGRCSLVVKVMESWLACYEFKPSTVEDPPGNRVPAQVSSSSLDHGSKLRGPSPSAGLSSFRGLGAEDLRAPLALLDPKRSG
ncbi:hypothetical protein TNCV_3364921 [Trichonephila clavipes]|nr:hypothetical protein TNCV_3364921 [Trichonephila clavipes]